MEHIIDKLETMLKNDKYIALSLYPGIGEKTIKLQGNRLFINDGKDGKFDNIDELLYDELVDIYDSRYKIKQNF